MINCFKKCLTCIGREDFIKKLQKSDNSIENVKCHKEIEVTNVISEKYKDDRKPQHKKNVRLDVCKEEPIQLELNNNNSIDSKKNCVKLPISKNTEVKNLLIKKEETPKIKKEETPKSKKEETPKVKKEETPKVKKEETPKVKKEETLSQLKDNKNRNSRETKSPILVKTEKESNIKKVIINMKDNEWCKVDYI